MDEELTINASLRLGMDEELAVVEPQTALRELGEMGPFVERSDGVLLVTGMAETLQINRSRNTLGQGARFPKLGNARPLIPLELDGEEHTVTLARDGAPQLRWVLRGGAIVAPTPYADVGHGFARWADATLGADDAEAAIVLRRACSIGMSRGIDLDSYPTLADMPGLSPLCYSMQPERAPVAFRNRGLIRDYDDRPDALLADGPA